MDAVQCEWCCVARIVLCRALDRRIRLPTHTIPSHLLLPCPDVVSTLFQISDASAYFRVRTYAAESLSRLVSHETKYEALYRSLPHYHTAPLPHYPTNYYPLSHHPTTPLTTPHYPTTEHPATPLATPHYSTTPLPTTQLPTHYPIPTAPLPHCPLSFARCLLPTSPCLLRTAGCMPPTTLLHIHCCVPLLRKMTDY